MSIEAGRRLFATTHGRYDADTLPSTDTKTQRGRLDLMARRGDQPAQEALRRYYADLATREQPDPPQEPPPDTAADVT